MNMVKIWHAKETTVQISDALSSIDTSALLDSQSFSNSSTITGILKNVTIVEPEGGIDKQDFLGVDSNNFQNAELIEKPYDLAKISGTLVLPPKALFDGSNKSLEYYAYGSGTQVPTGTPTHTRWQAGNGSRNPCAILVNLVSGSDYEVSILLNNAYITKLGDRRIGGPDGHWEQDFEAVCLPRDYYVEMIGTST